MDPILITGASGLVGRALVPLLHNAGLDVVSSGLSSPDVDEPGHDLSVDAAGLLNKVQPGVIVHLAGGTGGVRAELHRKNVVATTNLMHAAALLNPSPYVVLLGSSAEYGDGNGSPLTEHSPLQPVSEYGRSKLAQTTSAREIADRCGIQLTVVRPFNLVSADLPTSTALGRLKKLMLSATTHQPTISCGRLDIVRDYIAVDILAETIHFLIDHRPEVRVVNVCSGIGLSLGDVVWAMAGELDLSPDLVEDSELASLPAAERMVGDPSLLNTLIGRSSEHDARDIARIVLGP